MKKQIEIMFKRILLALILCTQAHAGILKTARMYATFWKMVACQKIIQPDPHQYEHLPNNLLMRMYLEVGSKASWANRTSHDLKIMGDQLRWNHEVYAELTSEQLRTLENYKPFEAEHDGLRPWMPRNVGEQ